MATVVYTNAKGVMQAQATGTGRRAARAGTRIRSVKRDSIGWRDNVNKPISNLINILVDGCFISEADLFCDRSVEHITKTWMPVPGAQYCTVNAGAKGGEGRNL